MADPRTAATSAAASAVTLNTLVDSWSRHLCGANVVRSAATQTGRGSSPPRRWRGCDPPKLHEKPVPVIRDADLRALPEACAGCSFEDRRDTAIPRLFMNTGARLSEVAGLGLDDVDLDHGEVWVRRMGARHQVLPVAKTITALDRYLRARRGHRFAALAILWLGAHGALTDSGIAQMARRRCRNAGIDPINVHRFHRTRGAPDEDARRCAARPTRRCAPSAEGSHRRCSPATPPHRGYHHLPRCGRWSLSRAVPSFMSARPVSRGR
jgi:integrase